METEELVKHNAIPSKFHPILLWSRRSETPSILLGFTPSLCTDTKHNFRWYPNAKRRDKIQSLSYILLNTPHQELSLTQAIWKNWMMLLNITDLLVVFWQFFLTLSTQTGIWIRWTNTCRRATHHPRHPFSSGWSDGQGPSGNSISKIACLDSSHSTLFTC